MNYAAMAFKMAQTDFQLGADILYITGNYLNSKMKESQLKAQEKNFGSQAEAIIKSGNNISEQYRWQRAMIGEKLGDARGDIISSAAGSGMDITSSRTVQKALKDTTRSAYRDMAISARNEYYAMQNLQSEWMTAKSNQIWTHAAREQERANRRLGVLGGSLGALANFANGVAGSMQALGGS